MRYNYFEAKNWKLQTSKPSEQNHHQQSLVESHQNFTGKFSQQTFTQMLVLVINMVRKIMEINLQIKMEI